MSNPLCCSLSVSAKVEQKIAMCAINNFYIIVQVNLVNMARGKIVTEIHRIELQIYKAT